MLYKNQDFITIAGNYKFNTSQINVILFLTYCASLKNFSTFRMSSQPRPFRQEVDDHQLLLIARIKKTRRILLASATYSTRLLSQSVIPTVANHNRDRELPICCTSRSAIIDHSICSPLATRTPTSALTSKYTATIMTSSNRPVIHIES